MKEQAGGARGLPRFFFAVPARSHDCHCGAGCPATRGKPQMGVVRVLIRAGSSSVAGPGPMAYTGEVDPTRAEESAESAPLARGRTLEGVLAGILASATDNVYAFDRQLRYIYVNEHGARMYGRTPAEVLGKTWDELLPPEIAGPAKRQVAEVIATRKSHREEILFPVGGEERFFEYVLTPVLDAQGEVDFIVSIGRDTTERKRAELAVAEIDAERARLLERAEHARAEAEKASRAKDEFLAMLGHELRNPLSPILTALQLMRLRAPELLVKERTIVERQVQHLVGLVDDLLDVSRITGGKIELKKRRLEMAEVLGKAVEMASPLLEQRRHRLSVSVPPAGLLVDGDEGRLAQVFANLLTNAAKYTEPGGDVAVAAERTDGHIVVRVRDSGMGIAPELLPRIFDLFVQSERTLDRSQGGLGLGLAIVKSLVGLHGGTVHADSHGPGKGSEMSVRLPVAASVEAGPSSEQFDAAPPFSTGTRLRGGRRVLVVDDNRDAAETLADGLRALGHEVFVAHDGPSALELAARVVPDLAFLDIGLPVMDGYELARRLHETPQLASVSLVALTGYGQAGDRRRSRVAGFHEHLVKPVDLSRIVSLLAALPARAAEEGDSLTSAGL